MELIKEIYDSEITSKDGDYFDKTYKVRKATRALVFNDKNEIAILYVSKGKYHKLPSGSVEKGEELIESLKREIIEEVGCEITLNKEVGLTIEYRDEFVQLQISYCYLANVKGEIMAPNFTEKELFDGFSLIWVNLKKAIQILKNDEPNNYVGKFIRKRDLCFLLKAKEIIE